MTDDLLSNLTNSAHDALGAVTEQVDGILQGLVSHSDQAERPTLLVNKAPETPDGAKKATDE